MRSLLVCAAVAAATAGSTLDFSRVHYVDHSASGNFLFRSNMPVLVNSTTNTSYFAYDALISYMKQRIATEAPAGTTFPAEFYLNIHSLDNIFEASDTQYEVAWAQANPTIGNVSFWPLLGQLVPPQWVNTSERDSLATNNTALWGVDELPQRMTSIRDMLEAQYDVPHVFLYHCEAGCDRTGEFSAAYYMTYLGMNVTAAYARDTANCGRAPNYWATNAIAWYCLTLEMQQGAQVGDCLSLPTRR